MSDIQRFAFDPHRIPSELKGLSRWCVWREFKGQKIPRRIDDRGNAMLREPSSLVTFATALEAYERPMFSNFDGLGVFLSKQDSLFCLDLDSCVSQNRFSEWAVEIINEIQSYTEISPSGVGVKIIGYGELPHWINCRKSFRLGRFSPASPKKSSECLVIREGMVTVTGQPIMHRDIEVGRVDSISDFCNRLERESRPPTPAAAIKSPTKLPPDSIESAVDRLLKCKMPEETSDGSKKLYSLIYFMIEKWQFTDDDIHTVLQYYHERSPLKMLNNASDQRSIVQTRIAQVRRDSGIEERHDINSRPLVSKTRAWNDLKW